MSWPWIDPSPKEAEEAYSYYKVKYERAASQKYTSERQEAAYIAEKTAAVTKLNSLSSQKASFEKRLRGIEEIIRILEGTGGWLSANVPEAIENAKKSLSKADTSFSGSMRLSGVAGTMCLQNAFLTKTVEEDTHSATALAAFRAEKARLETELDNLHQQLDSLSDLVSSLKSKINACNATQRSLKHSMNSHAYDMNHYRKYLY